MNDLFPTEAEFVLAQRLAKMFCRSGLLGHGDNAVQVARTASLILAGRELGFGPWAAVTGIRIVGGRPAISANLMAAALNNSPRYGCRLTRLDDLGCTLIFRKLQADRWEDQGESSFTADDARTAGLLEDEYYRRYPRNMYFARAISNGVRWYAADLFAGNTLYTPDEIGSDGNLIEDPPMSLLVAYMGEIGETAP